MCSEFSDDYMIAHTQLLYIMQWCHVCVTSLLDSLNSEHISWLFEGQIVKVAQSCDSLWPHRLYSPWNSPGQNTGVDSLYLLQGIFPTQGSNPVLPKGEGGAKNLSGGQQFRLPLLFSCSVSQARKGGAGVTTGDEGSRASQWPFAEFQGRCLAAVFKAGET